MNESELRRDNHDLQMAVQFLRANRVDLEARVAELSRVDWYWDDSHLECAIPADEAGENNSTGDILELRPVHELPKVFMLLTDIGHECFDTLEAAEERAKEVCDGNVH